MSDKVAEIRQDVKKLIESRFAYKTAHGDYVSFSFESYNQSMDDRRIGAEFGYSLAQQEIERLKGLIEIAFDAHNIWTKGKQRYERNWQKFKTENNL